MFNHFRSVFHTICFVLFLFFVIGLSGCATPSRVALPARYVDQAEAVGIPGVRARGGKHSDVFQKDIVKAIQQNIKLDPALLTDETKTVDVLAISGGGANGAFSVGVLSGWKALGTRPDFTLVTGISTGALIAPFAFLNPQYDKEIIEMYTSISTKDIFRKKSIFSLLLGSESLADSSPLAKMIAKYVDEKFLASVAREYAKGRRLFIGTTNLDARRLIVWNMGAIAASGKPEALKLFRDIMRASASIPVAFPPVFIPVEADGKIYDEMHVDGGVITEVFFYGFMVDLDEAFKELNITKKHQTRLFIIRNNQIEAQYEQIPRRLFPITKRSLDALTSAHGLGDLYRIYLITQRDGTDFNLASIPPEFVPNAKEAFDPVEMKRLYKLGYDMAKSGYPWQKIPPLFRQ